MQISAQKLTKNFGNKIAVKEVDLDIYPGKILALLGPNGAGKSTTIKMLTGQLHPSSGKILIDKKEYNSFPVKARHKLGVMPQEIIVWEDLNIQENLEFTASLFKISTENTKSRVQQLISDLKLDPERKTLAKNLSGGYKRRLNLAVSIVHDPQVIFLDEPTPGIDAQSRILLTDYIENLVSNQKKAIVLTDHYLEEAEKLADYVVIIDNGQVITKGTVAELKSLHGQGNLLQIHLDPKYIPKKEILLKAFETEFPGISLNKETLNVLVKEPSESLARALKIVQQENLKVLNTNIKESSLEDIFLLLTGKDVRE